jgi:putative transposase
MLRQFDVLHLDLPFAGARIRRLLLRGDFAGVGRRRMGTLILHMQMGACCAQPSKRCWHRAHPIALYLMRHRTMIRRKDTGARDIIHIPMEYGFTYLAAVLDCASWRVLSWHATITASISASTSGIERYFTLHSSRRPHSSLTQRTPDDANFCPTRCKRRRDPHPRSN